MLLDTSILDVTRRNNKCETHNLCLCCVYPSKAQSRFKALAEPFGVNALNASSNDLWEFEHTKKIIVPCVIEVKSEQMSVESFAEDGE